jgi:Zn-dependent M16 (insulinase) family peptidase
MLFNLFCILGPIADGFISLATKGMGNGGELHCLEHMIFFGTSKYPRGFIELH